jgi:hypothetical protein
MNHLHIACCHFYLGDFDAATKAMRNGPPCQLKERLTYCIASKSDDTHVRPLPTGAGGGGDAALEQLQNQVFVSSLASPSHFFTFLCLFLSLPFPASFVDISSPRLRRFFLVSDTTTRSLSIKI